MIEEIAVLVTASESLRVARPESSKGVGIRRTMSSHALGTRAAGHSRDDFTARPEERAARAATRVRLFLAVANFRTHAALFAPLLSPTLSGSLRAQGNLQVLK